MAIPFPIIDPVAVQIGPIAIHWYALAYIVGIFGGWKYAWYLIRRHNIAITKDQLDDALFWAAMGIIFGGRLGYVLFYKPDYYWQHPLEILQLWNGGMSFHGGFLGVVIAVIAFCRYHRLSFWKMIDVAACVTPIGLLLGRLANFINGELYGRVTDVSWAMVFPRGGDLPRHPSQLYEAFGEGVVMLAVFYILQKHTAMLKHPSMAAGLFLWMYGTIRFLVEYAREPDDFLGLLQFGLSMGQWLCAPMILGGLLVMIRAGRKPHA
jgi:phosphatidylglycerol:prolipoprotein diacylglycerol transferase